MLLTVWLFVMANHVKFSLEVPPNRWPQQPVTVTTESHSQSQPLQQIQSGQQQLPQYAPSWLSRFTQQFPDAQSANLSQIVSEKWGDPTSQPQYAQPSYSVKCKQLIANKTDSVFKTFYISKICFTNLKHFLAKLATCSNSPRATISHKFTRKFKQSSNV